VAAVPRRRRAQRSLQDSWGPPPGEPLAVASEDRRSVQARAGSVGAGPASGSGPRFLPHLCPSGSGKVVDTSPKGHFSHKWGYYRFNDSGHREAMPGREVQFRPRGDWAISGTPAPTAEQLSRDNVFMDVVDSAVEMFDKQIGWYVLDGNGDPAPIKGLEWLFYGFDVDTAVEMFDKQIGWYVLDGNGDPAPIKGLEWLFHGADGDTDAPASGVGDSHAALPGARVPRRSAAQPKTSRGRPRRGIHGAGVPASKQAEEGYDFSRSRARRRARGPV